MGLRSHDWAGAAVVALDADEAAEVSRRGRLRLPDGAMVKVLEVLCRHCRRPYELCSGTPCQLGPQHVGGPRRPPEEPEIGWE